MDSMVTDKSQGHKLKQLVTLYPSAISLLKA